MAYSNSWVNSTPTGSLVITVSPTIHDVLIGWKVSDSTGSSFVWPADFTVIASQVCTADGQVMEVAIKEDATGSETSVAISGSSGIGGVIAFSGRENVTPLDFTTNLKNDNTAQASAWTLDSDSLTPATNDCDICVVYGSDITASDDPVHTFSTVAGTTGAWTTRQDQNSGFYNVGIGTATQTTAGAFTARGTGTIATRSAGRTMVTVGLQSASGGGGGPSRVPTMTMLGAG